MYIFQVHWNYVNDMVHTAGPCVGWIFCVNEDEEIMNEQFIHDMINLMKSMHLPRQRCRCIFLLQSRKKLRFISQSARDEWSRNARRSF